MTIIKYLQRAKLMKILFCTEIQKGTVLKPKVVIQQAPTSGGGEGMTMMVGKIVLTANI